MKLVLALLGGVMAATPTGKVIELLDELKGKVEADLATEGKAMGEYTEYCDDELTEKAYAIKTAKREIAGFEAAIEDANGKYEKNTALLEELGADIAKKQAELTEAKKVRSGENKDFVAAQKELVDSIDMLSRAASVLKRELSFAQGAKGKKAISAQLKNAVGALSAIVNAAWVDPKAAAKVQAFLEEDDLSLAQQIGRASCRERV